MDNAKVKRMEAIISAKMQKDLRAFLDSLPYEYRLLEGDSLAEWLLTHHATLADILNWRKYSHSAAMQAHREEYRKQEKQTKTKKVAAKPAGRR